VVRLALNGVVLAYESHGSGPPVLLLHGLGSDRRSWRAQCAALENRHRVIAVDLRGHGESSRPRSGYQIAQLAADVAALVETLELPPAHVVGLSLGGMVAFQLAVDRPELVRSLVIVNSGPSVIPRNLREGVQLVIRLLLTWLLGPAGLAKPIARRVFPAPEQEPLRRELEAQVAAQPRRSYRLLTQAIVGWTVEERLDRVRCPVLLVSGDRDYTPVERKRQYLPLLRDARLVVIENSDHATPVDQPDRFNDHLLHFLNTRC
jgi:pimeloyl-ACP methyl ester carboxylesterase